MFVLFLVILCAFFASGRGFQGCFDQIGCNGNQLHINSTDPSSQIRECCLSTRGLSYRRQDGCVDCVVYGFLDDIFSEFERSQPYQILIAYSKGTGPNIRVNVESVTGGTAIEGADFTVRNNLVLIQAGMSDSVSTSFRVDSVAQENVETATLRLIPTTNNLPGNAIFRNEITLEIFDSDVVVFQLTNNDYRSSEADLMIRVAVSKNVRLANEVRFTLRPFNISEAQRTGQRLPSSIPPDNPQSPNRAKSYPPDRQDFSSEVITVVFPADEFGNENNDVDSPVNIFDDEINEALDEVFIIVLNLKNAVNHMGINISRSSSLCFIRDNDDLRIGFQNSSYTFTEPQFETDIEVVFLEKENGRLSEQTFFIEIYVSSSTPSRNIQPASLETNMTSNDYSLGNLGQSFAVLSFEPEIQKLNFFFLLYPDNVREGTEAFQATSAPDVSFSLNFAPPITLFASTYIIIIDDDPAGVVIGFEQNFTVAENIGSFQVCFRVISPTNDVPLNVSINLDVASIAGTAGSLDFTSIRSHSLDVFKTLNQTIRRACFDVQLTNDNIYEDSETFSLQLSLDQNVDLAIRNNILIQPSIAYVTIEDTTIIDCGMPPSIPNGFPGPSNITTFEGTVHYTCNSGYQISPGIAMATVSCLATGNWSTPTCLVICPDLQPLMNGAIIYQPDGTAKLEGSNATHSCSSGYGLSGGTVRVCQTDKTWSGHTITCPVMCPELEIPTNGENISYSSVDRRVRGTAVYSCTDDFLLSGSNTRTCQDSGTGGVWNGIEPSCLAICPVLETISNGAISYTTSSRVENSVATYFCTMGLELFHGPTRTCQNNHTWSGEEPYCQRVYVSLGSMTFAPNNSIIEIKEIGEGESNAGLQCFTDLPNCCNYSQGEWLIPNATKVLEQESGADIYTDRGDNFIRFNRRNTAPLPTGQYCCVLPTTEGMETFCVNVIGIIVAPSAGDPPTFGQNYSLSCTVTGADSLDTIISHRWTRRSETVGTNPFLTFNPLVLSDTGKYRCEVTLSSNIFSENTRVVSDMFAIEIPTVFIQLLFRGIHNCPEYRQTNVDGIIQDVTKGLIEVINNLCRCDLTPNHVSNSFLQCFPNSPKQMAFRAQLNQTSQATTKELVSYMDQWIKKPGHLTVQGLLLRLNTSCSLVITDQFVSSECPMLPGEHTTTGDSPSSQPYNTGIIISAVVILGLGLILLAVTAVIISYLVLKHRKMRQMTLKRYTPDIPLSDVGQSLQKCTSVDSIYEEIDKPSPPKRNYEFNQCVAYGTATSS